MYNISLVNDGLFGLIGWNDTNDSTTYPVLEADLLVSRSGLKVQEEHPLLTPENIYHIMPEEAGNIDSVILSRFIRERTKASANRLLRQVITAKKTEKITKSIFENLKIFNGAGRLKDTIIKKSRFVGLELNLKRFENITAKIERIGLQFTQIQTNLNIYIFHSSQEQPIHTETITTTKNNSFEWITPATPIYLNFFNENYDTSGVFYIGYFEDDISGQAINKDIDFSQPFKVCNTCGGSKDGYNTINQYIKIYPFEVQNSDLNGLDLWDIQNNRFINNRNFGLNLALSMRCDLTNFILRNEDILSNALSKQIALDFLWEYANTIQTSGAAEKLKQHAQIALMNSEGNAGSMQRELNELIKGLNFDFSNLGSPCLPSSKKGISLRSI